MRDHATRISEESSDGESRSTITQDTRANLVKAISARGGSITITLCARGNRGKSDIMSIIVSLRVRYI